MSDTTDEPSQSRRPVIREEGYAVTLNGKVIALVLVALVGGGASSGAVNLLGGGATAKAIQDARDDIKAMGVQVQALSQQFVEWRAQSAAREEIYRSRVSVHDEELQKLDARVQKLEERGRPR